MSFILGPLVREEPYLDLKDRVAYDTGILNFILSALTGLNLGATFLEKGVCTYSEYPKENTGKFPVISQICLFSFLSFMILKVQFSSVQFTLSVVSDSLGPHESQHASPLCPSPTPRVHSDSRPSSP